MKNIIIKSPDKDMYGTKKENIFYAYKDGCLCGTACLYPFFGSPDIEYHHKIYLGIYPENNNLTDEVKDTLIEKSKNRATEIKIEVNVEDTKLYACFLEHDKDEINYFISRGFVHDSGMYIVNRNLENNVPAIQNIDNIDIQAWKMESEQEQLKFIETHKQYFRFHYSLEKINELIKKPLWNNFTVFSNDEIVGNVMLFEESVEDNEERIGWIEDLFVRKDFRNKGIAKQLLVHSLNYFKNNGIYKAELEVWSENNNALSLYKSLGFEIIKETEVALSIYI